jgi:HlyD family secretion protein
MITMMPKSGYECEIIWKDIISRNDWNLIKESRFQVKAVNVLLKETNQVYRRRLIVRSKRWKWVWYSKEIKNFLITAPVSGRLTSFEPILGKTFQAGESIGRIDSREGYKLSAQVDEFYLRKSVWV